MTRQLPAGVTERQAQVLDLLLRCKSDKEIANALHISRHTVRLHLYRTRLHLGVTSQMNRMELAIWWAARRKDPWEETGCWS